jgi:hypothetical protein
MDGCVAIRHYLDRMIHGDDKLTSGDMNMKALLLNAATTQIVSAVHSQTEASNNNSISSLD